MANFERNVHDAETLKAVAHPTRSKILGLLRHEGPATASQLARRLDDSSGSTSYHLRQLARYGFVEEDPDQPNKRDKRWRATYSITTWSRAVLSSPEGREISDALQRRQMLRAVDHFQRWMARGRDPRWEDSGGVSDFMVRLTPSQTAALDDELMAVLDRYRTDPPPAEPDEPVAHISVYLQLLNFEESPL
ncbi:ArsR/SmtB family transcription factor [Phytohabitans aurantiacus]|uniref:Transcriptional regulator n=1 Tax=Phytohabitans aurantiacus TaxID=3016789 RepID=A0ABQ5QW08_9ACTN|nr:helix-turn-helix domain-containing protein [Phytohabitans aurantiacus]GLH98086.1 transcriptional regulator [Phytohabitans aurantiacus]